MNRQFVQHCVLAILVAGSAVGCSHWMESRAINVFAKNLESADLDGLKAHSSDDFQQRALRTTDAMEDLKILRIPDGKTTVVEVEDLNDSKKRVTVEIGDTKKMKGKSKKNESKKEVFYELTKDDHGRWVVDDIYLKQKKKGVVAYKSVTEQMDLLLTVREFLDAWGTGSRDDVLNTTTPTLRESLEQLPPTYLVNLTRRVASGRPKGSSYKPVAQMDEKIAIVRLPRLSGECVITMELIESAWKVADIGIESKDDDQVTSMHKLSRAVNGCTAFLDAYRRGDKVDLSDKTSPEFYQGSLAVGELSQVVLPDPQLSEHELQVKLRGT
ncbi:MAG: hypothetical protein FJ267_03800, partial [Planctomycetes bacterium]|nr:hypothetical protein [Planctomycetota bacterium]